MGGGPPLSPGLKKPWCEEKESSTKNPMENNPRKLKSLFTYEASGLESVLKVRFQAWFVREIDELIVMRAFFGKFLLPDFVRWFYGSVWKEIIE